MAEHQVLVSIITINYNTLSVTTEMLDSVRKLKYPNLEIIVVDNASFTNPKKVINEKYPEVVFIRSDKNLGFAGGNNLGICASKGEFLFFVNNDTELTDGLIENLLALFYKIDKLGAVSPKICFHPKYHSNKEELIQYAGMTTVNPLTARNRTIGAGEPDRGQYNQAVPTAYIHGAAMMLRRKVIEKVGMMPEVYFLYYEELDWCEYIRNAGYKIYVEPGAKIYHKESLSVGKMSTLKTFYLTRNRILFIRRHRSGFEIFLFSLFLLFFTLPKNLILYLAKGEWRHARFFAKAIFWHLKPASKSGFNPLPQLPNLVVPTSSKA